MSFHIIKAGLQTSIQDFGRSGQMHNGVSKSGAMDKTAMQMANWLVSKPLDSPLLEITMIAPQIHFSQRMSIAICGAEFEWFLNGNNIDTHQTIQVQANDQLKANKRISGLRAYLAFSATIDATPEDDYPVIKPVMGSYSTHLIAGFGGFKGRAFEDGDWLRLMDSYIPENKTIPKNYMFSYSGSYFLRTVPSVETTAFTIEQREQFFDQSFQVQIDSDRMGIRLQGTPILFEQQIQLISSGLTQGSIQVPPNGQPIISSVDGQTLGGYPRIANVITADLPLLGQLQAGDKIRFSSVDKSLAITFNQQKQRWLDTLLVG
ncbi:MAG: biotin-dependent carboxyltransferase family protein [Gammaproteobacteria bacterium]|nr:biotin-dependent carboxyltransferase family protein [Gammaproteobacteria bacterium]